MLFFKARFEALQIYRNPGLRTFRSRPEILHGPSRWVGLVREHAGAMEDVAGVLSKNERLTLLRLLKKLGKHAAETRK